MNRHRKTNYINVQPKVGDTKKEKKADYESQPKWGLHIHFDQSRQLKYAIKMFYK